MCLNLRKMWVDGKIGCMQSDNCLIWALVSYNFI